MLLPSKVFNEYKTLVVEMAEDSVTIDIAKTNYELMCDPKTLMGLSCIIPLLELVYVATLALARDQGKGVVRCGPNSRPGSAIV
jgi:hypothetical protein